MIIYINCYVDIFFNYCFLIIIIISSISNDNFTKERRLYEHISYMIICICIYMFPYEKFFNGLLHRLTYSYSASIIKDQ